MGHFTGGQSLLTQLIPLVRDHERKCINILWNDVYDHPWEKSKLLTVECQTHFPLNVQLWLKKNYFHFYLVSKYKKSQDSYTNYLWDHAKQFRVYTTIIHSTHTHPLFCRFIQLFDRKLNGTCLEGKFHLFIETHTHPHTQPPTTNIQHSLLLCVCMSTYNLINFFYLGGTWDWKI